MSKCAGLRVTQDVRNMRQCRGAASSSEACLKALREGDVLVVWRLDRMGRNLHHLVRTISMLSERGVGLKVLTGQGTLIDTTTAAGRLSFSFFCSPGGT